MKRKLRNILRPHKPFEVWAQENNIDLVKPQNKVLKRHLSRWITLATSIALIVALLPIVFLFNNGNYQEKIYSSLDSETERISIEELYQNNDLLLFSLDQVIQVDTISKDFPINDKSIILSYDLYNCLILTRDANNAFYVNYKIRTYANYEFFGYSLFSKFKNSYTIGNLTVDYKIVDGKSQNIAYLKFKYHNADYFLEVTGFEGITEINTVSIQKLLNDLFLNII